MRIKGNQLEYYYVRFENVLINDQISSMDFDQAAVPEIDLLWRGLFGEDSIATVPGFKFQNSGRL